jgi:hypothetical protein
MIVQNLKPFVSFSRFKTRLGEGSAHLFQAQRHGAKVLQG